MKQSIDGILDIVLAIWQGFRFKRLTDRKLQL